MPQKTTSHIHIQNPYTFMSINYQVMNTASTAKQLKANQ